MSIFVRCQCGKKYSVSDDKAGKRIRCRACNEIIEVPDDRWGDDDEVYEEDAAGADEFEETTRRRSGPSRSRPPRRQSSNNALPLIIAGAVVGGLLVLGAAVFAFRAGANPAPVPVAGSPPVV